MMATAARDGARFFDITKSTGIDNYGTRAGVLDTAKSVGITEVVTLTKGSN